jgi:acid phosphatase
MLSKLTLAALLSAAVVAAQSDSEVVAVFMLGRHGDRTPKVQGNTLLTTLGKNQVFESAQYFHNRYLNSSSPDYIQGVNSSYLYSQIYAQAP